MNRDVDTDMDTGRDMNMGTDLSFMQGQLRMIFHIYILKKYVSWWQWSVRNTLDSISQNFDLVKFDFFAKSKFPQFLEIFS
jgi:hypothetical protein